MNHREKTLPTIAFYGFALGAAYIINEISPSGPCVPGLGLLFFFLLPIISFILLLKNVVQLERGQSSKKPTVLTHTIALAVFILTLFI